jgi:uncharacterized protein (TIGR03086 family)
MTATMVQTDLYRRAAAGLDGLVQRVQPHHLDLPTPCSLWDVRALLNHVVSEARWTPPLLAGLTIEAVGKSLDGDVPDGELLTAWQAAVNAANASAGAAGVDERTVHLSFGDFPGSEYLAQLAADYLIHTWDLAVAIGVDARLDDELVAAVGAWFVPKEAAYRAAGATGPRPPVEHDGEPQARLLAMFGRSVTPSEAITAVDRFGAAFDRHDVDAVMAAMTADCVFEATRPPDGVRYEGQAEVRAAWSEFFAASGDAVFEVEEQFACGDRVVVRWRYTWAPGDAGYVRGVDIFTTRDGLVAEKLS